MNAPKKTPRRLLDGVLLLDKPIGLSSNDALVRAKRLFSAKKAGHTGTLDPLATGLLPLCFGEATKFSQDLLEADKTYEATLKLGERTLTGDAEGEVVERREVQCSASDVAAILERFRGDIKQVPPMYSALKRDGKPLYEYARAGETLEREARDVTILKLELIECVLPFATIRVTCTKGTYVRTLGEDIGEALGCGAHLTMLRRTGVGVLTLEGAVTLEQIDATPVEARDALLAPVDALLTTFDRVELDAEQTRRFLHGQKLRVGDRPAHGEAGEAERVRVYSHDSRLLGTAKMQEGVIAPDRLIASQADQGDA